MVVQVSTRPGRASDPIARWTLERARAHGKFEVSFVDLREEGLPLFDEPRPPRLGQYEHEHTKRWAAKVRAADAFVFVTPEYNFGMPPSLLNAVTYLAAEWAYKAAAFVSYGGASGGMRSAHAARGALTALKLVAIPEAVSLPFFAKSIEDGVLVPGEPSEKSATAMLDELARWSDALATLRSHT
jgi:NAD(P)H-dependent FMN reductase